MADAEIIVSYIRRKGWQAERAAGGWRITHAECDTPLYLSFTRSWICLQAPLTAYLPTRDPADLTPAQRVRLYRYLLACNESMFMAKFARDPDGTLTLQAELPLSGSVHRMDDALGALTRYLAQHGTCLSDLDTLDLPPADDRTSKELYFDAPPGIPPEVVAYFLRAVEPRGWGARSKPKGITWPLAYKGQRLFEAYLTITRAWSYFHITALDHVPVMDTQTEHAIQDTFLRYLLSANGVWFMAKLGLDETNRALVMLDIPTPELDFDTFRMVTTLLATYLDLYAREMQIMAHLTADTKLAERLTPG